MESDDGLDGPLDTLNCSEGACEGNQNKNITRDILKKFG